MQGPGHPSGEEMALSPAGIGGWRGDGPWCSHGPPASLEKRAVLGEAGSVLRETRLRRGGLCPPGLQSKPPRRLLNKGLRLFPSKLAASQNKALGFVEIPQRQRPAR